MKKTEALSARAVGSVYEEKAVQYLKEQGYRILERNFYSRQGEIDVIARDGTYLCFVEVKFRKQKTMKGALEAVNLSKQKKISKAALYYLTRQGYGDSVPCRFDVVGITPEEIFLLKDAFGFQV